jgi:hypothetical protein
MFKIYELKTKLPFKLSKRRSQHGIFEHLTPSQVRKLFPYFSACDFDIWEVQATVGRYSLALTLQVADEMLAQHGTRRAVNGTFVERESLGGANLYEWTRRKHLELTGKNPHEINWKGSPYEKLTKFN